MQETDRSVPPKNIESSILSKIGQISLPKREASEINLSDTLGKDLNIDSLGFIELIIEIENTFNITVDDDYLLMDAYPDVKSVLEYVTKAIRLK